jgi:tetratricopeptide (TPR) repeat protein
MYLGITLSRLNDFEYACEAYEKAIEMEADHLFELNYAITLYNHGTRVWMRVCECWPEREHLKS